MPGDDGYVKSFKSILFLGNFVGVAQFALADSKCLRALSAIQFVPFAASYVGVAYDSYRASTEDMLHEEVVILSYGIWLAFCINLLTTLIRFPYYRAARRLFERAILDVNEINKRLGLRPKYGGRALRAWLTFAAFVGCNAFVRWCAADMRASIKLVFFCAGMMHYCENMFVCWLLDEMAAQCRHLHRSMFEGLQFVKYAPPEEEEEEQEQEDESKKHGTETEEANSDNRRTKWRNDQDGRHDTLRSAYLDKFMELSQVHLEICRCAKRVNELFGAPFMLLIVLDFTMVTLALYDFCNGIVALNLSTYATEDLMKIYGNCMQILIIFARQMISIHSWSHLNKNLKETVLKIHKLWNVLSIDNQIGKWAGCIQLTTIQLSNAIPQFSASGIVAIDWPVIISIISAASTYVVILIQFGSIRRTVKEKGSSGSSNAPILPTEEIMLFPA